MDKLLAAAQFYNDFLLNRKFKLKAGKNKQEIEFDIVFAANNFKHLIGLNKLTDLPIISESSSAVNFRQILNNELTYKDISISKYFSEAEQRIEHFEDLYKTLKGKELLLKSQYGKFNTIVADFMLTNKDNNYGYAHLFMRNDNRKGFTVPVTYIIQHDNSYLQNHAERWTVLSVEEIKKADKKVKAKPKQVQTKIDYIKTEQIQPKKVVKKFEIEPLRVYGRDEKGNFIIKVSGKNPEDPKRIIKLPQNCVTLDRYRESVVATTAEIQKRYGFIISGGQSRRILK